MIHCMNCDTVCPPEGVLSGCVQCGARDFVAVHGGHEPLLALLEARPAVVLTTEQKNAVATGIAALHVTAANFRAACASHPNAAFREQARRADAAIRELRELIGLPPSEVSL